MKAPYPFDKYVSNANTITFVSPKKEMLICDADLMIQNTHTSDDGLWTAYFFKGTHQKSPYNHIAIFASRELKLIDSEVSINGQINLSHHQFDLIKSMAQTYRADRVYINNQPKKIATW